MEQVVLLGLSALLLDGGRAFRVYGAAAIAHWVAIVLIIAGRPRTPTPGDRAIIKWGFVPLAIVVGSLAGILSRPGR